MNHLKCFIFVLNTSVLNHFSIFYKKPKTYEKTCGDRIGLFIHCFV